MTVSSTTRKAGPFSGNGVTTVFPFNFKVFDKTNVKVLLVNNNGVSSTLVLDSDYSVSVNADQNNNPGGSIGYPISGSPLAAGLVLVALGSIANDQETDITNSGGFYPDVIEKMIDKSTIQIQQLAENVSRAIVLNESESATPSLPTPGARANMLLGFDPLGNLTVSPIPASLGAGDLHDEIGSDGKPGLVVGTDVVVGATQITLSRAPGSKANVSLHFDAAYQGGDQIATLNGVTLGLAAPGVPQGTQRVYIRTGTTLSTQIPPDGSVSDSKIAAGSKLANRTARVYDIRDFGALVDGVTDDAFAINAADAAVCAAGGGILVFPPGTTIAGSTVFRGSNVIWQGAGIGATVLRAKPGVTMNWLVSTVGADAMWGTGSVAGVYAIALRDMTIDGNKANGTHCGGFGLYGCTFSLDNYEIANCTGAGLRTEFGIPGIVPHGYNSQSNSNNALIHDCDGVGMIWGGPSDPSIVNNNVYRNQPYNMMTQVNGSGCKIVNSHFWGSVFDSRLSTTGVQLNTSGNMLVNCVSEGATVHQVHLRANDNIIYGGNYYYFSDAEATVYGITIGDAAASVASGANLIDTRIDNCKLGLINFSFDAGQNKIDITGFTTALNGVGYTGARAPNSFVRVQMYGNGSISNNAITVEPNQLFLTGVGGGGTGQVSVGAADSGGVGFRALRVPN